MKASVNQDLCIGCGMCEQLVPQVFRLNREGKSEVYGEITAELKNAVMEAAGQCPVEAIKVEN